MARAAHAVMRAVRRPLCGLALLTIAMGAPAGVEAQQLALAFGTYRLDVWREGRDVPGRSLPSNNVNFLAQSADGYLWLATPTGLTRFDGLRFQLVSATDSAFTGRLAYLIWPLLRDHEGRLWITTDRGMVTYANGRFTPAATDTTLENDAVQQLAEDAHGRLFGVTVRGMVFRLRGGHPVPIALPGVPPGDGDGIVADSDGTLWIARARAGLVRVRDGVVTRLGARDGLGDDAATSVVRARDGALWVGTRVGVARLAGGRITRVPFWGGVRRFPTVAGTEASDGAMWFATDGGGVVRVTADGDTYRAARFDHRDGLTDDRAIAILADDEGDIWVGTRLGLDRFHPVPFRALTTRNGLPSDAMGAILRDTRGDLWVAPVAGGLFAGRVVGGTARLARIEPQSAGRATTLGTGPHGTVWAGWVRGGVTAYRAGHRIIRLTARDGVARGTVYAILFDHADRLWVGASGGLTRMPDPLRRGWHGRARTFTVRDGLQETVAMRLWEDDSGAVWVGNAGLSRIIGDSVTTYRVRDGLAAPIVTALHPAPDGALWVATHGGLTRVRHGRLTSLRGIAGLSDPYIDAMVDDGLGYVWLAGASGLTRVSRRELDAAADTIARGGTARLTTAVTFGLEDGLPGQDAVLDASPEAFRAPDGLLWFAMAHGIAIVDPRHVPRDTIVPRPHVESVLADGAVLTHAGVAAIPPGTHRVEVRYTGISLGDGAGVQFRYRLDGLDTTWVAAGAERVATFTRLWPRRYTLEVAARMRRGPWSPTPATVALRVLPAFYETWWFVAAGAAVLSLAVLGAFRLRARHLAARTEGIIQERTRLARELHDTLLQGFTGIALQLRAHVTRPPAEPGTTSHALRGLVALAEATLGEAREAVWDMRAPHSMLSLWSRLERAARDAVRGTSVALDCSVAGEQRALPPATELELERIGREALANAVRHAAPKRVIVSLVYEARAVRLTVRDDGRGFAVTTADASAAAAARGHFGLVGMRERAAGIGADLAVVSAPGQGTTVTAVVSDLRAMA